MRDCRAAFLFHPAYLEYDLGPEHPLRPERQAALHQLLADLGWLRGRSVVELEPRPASDQELRLAHSAAYIEAVQALSAGDPTVSAESWGLGPGDTPACLGMHEWAAAIAGGTIAAVRGVMAGQVAHALNPGGGMHHAQRDRASGFCIYNDLVAGIATAVIEHGARVMYVDLDVHHGDGVQAAFYDDPRVLTVSFHETGRYLFPGTGAVSEVGTGAGVGYSVNVPLAPFTEDASWLEAVNDLLPALAERFRPDLIVSQHGCDGHVWDGQSHMYLTSRAYREAARLVHNLAHRYCDGRWVATGGGGYDPVRVVPRVWAALWQAMAGRRRPRRLPSAWLERWQPVAAGPLPESLDDPDGIVPEVPRRATIEAENHASAQRARELALSPTLRHAYRPCGGWTPGAVAAFPSGRGERWEVDGREVFVRERAPYSLMRRLHVAEDMHAFARDAKREAALLNRIARQPETNLTVVYTPEGEIVAEVTLAPAEGRWEDLDAVYEIAVEVARSWRGSGLAERLLGFVTGCEYVEELILIALGLSWHWDLERMGLSPHAYRDLLIRTFQTAGFHACSTDDPEIMAGEGNVLLARIGARVQPPVEEEFDRRLLSRTSWYGL